ncbi:MAG: carboxylesterase/lipase family protein [Christensenellaceae bacterium]|jgi:para-nitrobenzyl esterase
MPDVIVKTKNGSLRGFEQKGVLAYYGVPYAKAPVGALRFGKTQPAEDWQGVRDATKFGANAWQTRKLKWEMSEDCLFLNIWRPDTQKTDLPVMFFIHGGSFATGAGSDPELNGANLAKNGEVVVVTINYRLNVLGFLDFSFLDEAFCPNCGLYDILEALKWTHENIGAFGGDKENITVFGQSAGAICASVLSVMPEARPYIAKVIMMSGGPTLLYKKDFYQKIAKKYMEFMEIRTGEELMSLPAEKLALRHKEFASYCGLGAGTFMVEVDGNLVREYPIPAAKKGEGREIPILIGTTREEMSFFFIRPVADMLDIRNIMDSGVGVEDDEVKESIVRCYERYGKKGPAIMLSDMVFRMASMWFAESYHEHADTWLYRFDYATPAMKASRLHAFHSSDMPFVFGNFREGLARLMFLFSLDKRKYMRVYREMQQDFVMFAKEGRLAWEKVKNGKMTGKCYDEECTFGHIVEPDILEAYKKTDFRRRSFEEG